MDLKLFKELPVLGIIRGVKSGAIEPLTEAIVASGLKTVEIAMNTPGAAGMIKEMVRAAAGRLAVGAGTVLSLEELRLARDAGATFIVSPALIREVVEYCVENSMPVFPGAFTPREIYEAWRAGASMVKVFPAKFLGPDYIKEIKGPFNDIELLACGGVNSVNVRSFFEKGASAVAFGGSVFRKEWLEKGDFSRIENSIKELLKPLGE